MSCLGRDPLGVEARATLTALKVDHSWVAEDAAHPTGTVQVTLDESGRPSYEICDRVAWDFLPMSAELESLAQRADAVCFGSLAQRNKVTRTTIHAFLKQVRPDALKIFDVNLRQAFYTKDIIVTSLDHSNVLKLSDEELPVLARMFDLSGSVQEQIAELLRRFDLRLVANTRGAGGSLLMTPETTDDHKGFPVEVVDSVGAGDAFTAALCTGLLLHEPLSSVHDHANRVAAFVCSQQGATPVLPDDLTEGAHESRQ